MDSEAPLSLTYNTLKESHLIFPRSICPVVLIVDNTGKEYFRMDNKIVEKLRKSGMLIEKINIDISETPITLTCIKCNNNCGKKIKDLLSKPNSHIKVITNGKFYEYYVVVESIQKEMNFANLNALNSFIQNIGCSYLEAAKTQKQPEVKVNYPISRDTLDSIDDYVYQYEQIIERIVDRTIKTNNQTCFHGAKCMIVSCTKRHPQQISDTLIESTLCTTNNYDYIKVISHQQRMCPNISKYCEEIDRLYKNHNEQNKCAILMIMQDIYCQKCPNNLHLIIKCKNGNKCELDYCAYRH